MSERDQVIDAALALRRWAERTGVLGQGRSSGGVVANDLLRSGEMFSAGAGRAFVGKPIIAIGYAASGRREPRLFVYTRRKLTKKEQGDLQANQLPVPLEFRVAQPYSVTGPSEAALFGTLFKDGRLTCGSSISIGNVRDAGTMGALLRDSKGRLYGLSCNHVTGGCSNARVGVPITAPGVIDVGAGVPDPRTVGHHHRSLPFVQGDPSTVPSYVDNSDSAVFAVADEGAVSSWQGAAYDTPTVVEEPEEDCPVEKVGRTTGHTTGYVESRLVGAQRIDYSLTAYHSAEENSVFRGSVFFDHLYLVQGVGGSFSAEGDSGALVVRREQGSAEPQAAVGIVIGGRSSGESYVLPLGPILKTLAMGLVGGHL